MFNVNVYLVAVLTQYGFVFFQMTSINFSTNNFITLVLVFLALNKSEIR